MWTSTITRLSVEQGLPLAAVERDDGSVHEAGARRGDEHRHVRDFLGRADPAERDAALGPTLRLVDGDLSHPGDPADELAPPLGGHRPRVDRVHEDVLPPVLLGERHRHGQVGGVGRARRELDPDRLDPVVPHDVHDAAAALAQHVRDHRLDAPHVAHELQLERLLPVLLGQVEDLAAGRRARVVDVHVDPPEARGRRVDDALDVVGPREVSGHSEDLRAGRPRQLLGRGFERGLVPGADRHPDAFLGEPERDRLADALAAAGDQRRLSLQAEVHVRLLRRAGLTPASLSNIDRRAGGASMAKYLEGTDAQKSRAYSPAVITEGGRIVWLAGQTATVDSEGKDIAGNFEAQTHRVFALIDQTLRRAGGTLANLVTMTVFIKEPRYGRRFVELRRQKFPDGNYPGSALITVTNFARPGMEIEIQAIAVIGDRA